MQRLLLFMPGLAALALTVGCSQPTAPPSSTPKPSTSSSATTASSADVTLHVEGMV